MSDKWSRIALYLFIGILILSFVTACLRAKAPNQEKLPVESEGIVGPPTPPKAEPVVHSVEINAGLSGKEFSFENVKFTHMAIEADEDLEWMVRVWVAVNGDYVGSFYADGWEDKAEEKLRIGPGDISVWVPIRGTWLTGPNIIQLKFNTEGMGDLDLPARYFKGKLYLKNDPEALEKDESGKTPKDESSN